MMKCKLIYLFFVSVLMFSGCSSLNTKERVWRNMAIAGAAGVLVGQSRSEYKSTYSTMYGGVAAATAAALTVYFDDSDKEVERLRAEIRMLSGSADAFEKSQVTHQSPATFGAKVPEKYRGLINPGEWRVYQVDRWREDGENRMVHEDKIMELVPPSLRPGN
ncbi:hypothetical protein ACES2I_08815 [Bdellovibrio bacteriovorus]|uniref:hypothetical protein n=1 Tax=Bdellovibrio bacteriovorus TaxID=959 RepID=UPI0035A6A83E